MSFKAPKYCLMKHGNRAYSKHQGKRVYFGQYGTPESRKEHEEWVEQLRSEHEGSSIYRTTLDRLCIEFLKFAQKHYQDQDGNQTSALSTQKTGVSLDAKSDNGGRFAVRYPRTKP